MRAAPGKSIRQLCQSSPRSTSISPQAAVSPFLFKPNQSSCPKFILLLFQRAKPRGTRIWEGMRTPGSTRAPEQSQGLSSSWEGEGGELSPFIFVSFPALGDTPC